MVWTLRAVGAGNPVSSADSCPFSSVDGPIQVPATTQRSRPVGASASSLQVVHSWFGRPGTQRCHAARTSAAWAKSKAR